jgi:glucose-6-phosphate dehydrogenase-like protein OpcA
VLEEAMSATVSPDRILHDLAGLWVDLGKQAEDQGSTGVLRACTMTLIVLAEQTDDAGSIGETIARLMPDHPSRAIVIRVTGGAGRTLDSRVFSQCWVTFGERRHICAEQIEITTSAEALAEIPAVVLPLTVPDLPVVLWCRGGHLFDLPGSEDIAGLATKVICDGAGFERMESILRRGQAGADLAWTRLTRWRELIARIFENRGLASLSQVSSVRVAWPAPSSLYLAAWLLDGLRRAGANPTLDLRDARVDREVELAAPGLHVAVSQCGSHCAEVRINDVVSQTALPDPSEYSLMREELAIPGHDAVFERVLPLAAQVALSS